MSNLEAFNKSKHTTKMLIRRIYIVICLKIYTFDGNNRNTVNG